MLRSVLRNLLQYVRHWRGHAGRLHASRWNVGHWFIQSLPEQPSPRTDDDFAVLVCNTVHPEGASANRSIRVTLYGEADGDQIRLAFDYVDANNYLAVEVQFGNCGVIRVIERSGGTDTTIGNDLPIPLPGGNVPNSQIQLQIHYKPAGGDSNVRVEMHLYSNAAEPYARSFWRTVTAAGGDQVAICTGNVVDRVYADFFTFARLISDISPGSRDVACIAPFCAIHVPTFQQWSQACEWTTTGSWTFAQGGSPTMTCTSAGVAICNYPDDSPLADRVYAVSVAWTGTNQKPELIFDRVDASNYHTIRRSHNGTDYVVQLLKVTAGSSSVVYDFGIDNATTSGAYSAAVNGVDGIALIGGTYSARVSISLHGGREVGIGTATATTTFSTFGFKLGTTCADHSDADRPCPWYTKCNFGDVTDDASYDGDYGDMLKVVLAGITGTCTECGDRNGTIISLPSSFAGSAALPGYNGPSAYIGSGGPTCCENGFLVNNISINPTQVIFKFSMDCTYDTSPLLIDNLIQAYWTYTMSAEEQCDLTAVSNAAMTLGASETLSRCVLSGATATLSSIPFAS